MFEPITTLIQRTTYIETVTSTRRKVRKWINHKNMRLSTFIFPSHVGTIVIILTSAILIDMSWLSKKYKVSSSISAPVLLVKLINSIKCSSIL